MGEKSHTNRELFAVSIVLLLTVAVRATIDFSNSLMPKVNGGYYLVQVRSLLETGHLAFSDLPFLFWIELFFAKGILLLSSLSIDNSVLLASKITDIIIPALSCIPVFFIARAFANEKSRLLISSAVALFSTLSLSALSLVGDFQKNAVAMTFFAALLYMGYVYLQQGKRVHLAAAALFLALIGFTHIGTFVIASLWCVIVLCVRSYHSCTFDVKKSALWGVGFLAALMVCAFGMWVVAPHKLDMFVQTVFKGDLFKNPEIFALPRTAQGAGANPLMFAFVIVAIGICVWRIWARWRNMLEPHKTFIVSLLLLCLSLSNIFLNTIIFGRFQLILYLPFSILLAFLLSELSTRWSTVAAIALIACTTVPVFFMLPILSRPSVSPITYADLQELSTTVAAQHHSLVITKHGLEWWAAWVLHADVSQEFNLNQDTWDQYSSVYFLVEKNPSPGNPFKEVRVPLEAQIVVERENLKLYTSAKSPAFYPLVSPN